MQCTAIKDRVDDMNSVFARTILVMFLVTFALMFASGYVDYRTYKSVTGVYFMAHVIPFLNTGLAFIITIYRFKQATDVISVENDHQTRFKDWMDRAKPLTFDLIIISGACLISVVENTEGTYFASTVFTVGFSYSLILKAACGVKVEKD